MIRQPTNGTLSGTMTKHYLAYAIAALFLFPLPDEAAAQAFPNRPLTMVVPFAAGGPTDIVARAIGERLASSFGQPVIVDNVAGAAGTTGAARVAGAPADGYTLLMGPMSTMSFSPALYPALSFDPIKDFEPLGIVAAAPIVLVARMQTPGHTMAEFVARLRAHGGKMTYGHAGVGSTSHLSCLRLNSQIGVDSAMVSYRGTAPAIQDLLAGKIDYLCDQSTSVMSHVNAGTIKPLAVLAPTRSQALPPDVLTAAEAGFPAAEMVVWNALFAPKGTPRAVVMQINAAIGRGLNDSSVRRRFEQLGAEAPLVDDRSPEALGRVLARDIEKWGAVIRAANIKLK
jgi:tripartite-type tricarboxylate transporter receptor subunit TctC